MNFREIAAKFPGFAAVFGKWQEGIAALIAELRAQAARLPDGPEKDYVLARATLWEGIAAGGVGQHELATAISELRSLQSTGESPIEPDASDGQ